ncbi:MAG: hypothetical protein JW757_05760 [Anaerolineales bacterium]|nr:hypothetical protein [Anaerolineales bacterium]
MLRKQQSKLISKRRTNNPAEMKRIHVIGQGGAGKTSLAAEVSARLGIPHIELDSVFWYENWQQSPPGKFESQVAEVVAGDAWVLDGNYRRARPIIWPRVETVVWLDYPLLVCLWRLFWRTIGRIINGEMLWGTNQETFSKAFFSKESLFLYVIKGNKQRRETYTQLMADPANAGINFVRLRFPSETRRWLEEVSASTGRSVGRHNNG